MMTNPAKKQLDDCTEEEPYCTGGAIFWLGVAIIIFVITILVIGWLWLIY